MTKSSNTQQRKLKLKKEAKAKAAESREVPKVKSKRRKSKKSKAGLLSTLVSSVPKFIHAEESPLVGFFVELTVPFVRLGSKLFDKCLASIAKKALTMQIKALDPLKDFGSLNLEAARIMDGLAPQAKKSIPLNKTDSAETLVAQEQAQKAEKERREKDVKVETLPEENDESYAASLQASFDKEDAEEAQNLAEAEWIVPKSRNQKKRDLDQELMSDQILEKEEIKEVTIEDAVKTARSKTAKKKRYMKNKKARQRQQREEKEAIELQKYSEKEEKAVEDLQQDSEKEGKVVQEFQNRSGMEVKKLVNDSKEEKVEIVPQNDFETQDSFLSPKQICFLSSLLSSIQRALF